MDLDSTHPELSDLARRASRRIPRFVWEYLESGTGAEATAARNRAAFDQVLLQASILHGEIGCDLSAELMGRRYALPFGIAPVGMSGLIWPGAEQELARLGAKTGIPYCLSTVASQAPEDVGPHIGDQGWFQLYPPRDPEILADMLGRVRDAGFHTVILTADVPVASRRERLKRSGLRQPPRLTPRLMLQTAMRPAWALATARAGMPRMRFIDSYAPKGSALSPTAHAGYLLRTSPDRAYLDHLRATWDGKLVVKGVLQGSDGAMLKQAGVDAVWVSNHAGRQFDGGPASIDRLADIRAAVGPDFPLIFDSGIASGTDILRAFALGANFVMLGRAFHYGLAAFGAAGAAHVVHILTEGLKADMGQLGLERLADAPSRLIPDSKV